MLHYDVLLLLVVIIIPVDSMSHLLFCLLDLPLLSLLVLFQQNSLGGGIALISGAQTGLTSIGISAPNALLSRRTFGITKQALKTHTFNVIPNRDPVPRIDDVSDLYQRIECRTDPANFLGCHNVGRTLCELQYMCGSGDRPTLCSCVQKFGYPKPTQLGNRTFEEACIAKSDAVDKTATTRADDETDIVP